MHVRKAWYHDISVQEPESLNWQRAPNMVKHRQVTCRIKKDIRAEDGFKYQFPLFNRLPLDKSTLHHIVLGHVEVPVSPDNMVVPGRPDLVW